MTDIAKGLTKTCPICDQEDVADEAQVLPGGVILYKFKCSRCGWPHVKRVRAPVATVEPLVGFSRKPYSWEPRP